MPSVLTSPVVRSILTADINLSADEVIKRAKAKGVTAPDGSIRGLVYNIRAELKKKGAKAPPPKPVLAAARTTNGTKPTPAPKAAPKAGAATGPAPKGSSPAPGLSAVLANVALVNTVVGASGGIEPARQVAEAVRACGSVEAFLQHLDLVAKVRGGASA